MIKQGACLKEGNSLFCFWAVEREKSQGDLSGSRMRMIAHDTDLLLLLWKASLLTPVFLKFSFFLLLHKKTPQAVIIYMPFHHFFIELGQMNLVQEQMPEKLTCLLGALGERAGVHFPA